MITGEYNFAVRKNDKSETVRRSQDLQDKSRNEQQKAMLLRESIAMRQARTSRELCQKSERLVTRSKQLCGEAKRLQSKDGRLSSGEPSSKEPLE